MDYFLFLIVPVSGPTFL